MENLYGTKTSNAILRHQFTRGEFSYALSDLTKALGPIIDLYFIGHYIGSDGLAVISYIVPLITFFELIGNILGNGSRARVSYLVGAGDMEQANQVFSTSTLAGAGISTLFSLLTYILMPAVVFMLGARDPLWIDLTKAYLAGYLLGVPFYTLTRILKMYLEMDGKYIRLNIAFVMTTVIDIIGDIVVIRFFNKSMFGLGLATSLGYIIPFVLIGGYFLQRKAASFKLSLKGFRLNIFKDIMKMGSSSGFIKGSHALGGILINNMLTDMGVPYLVSSYGVFSQITSFVRSAWFAPTDTMFSFIGVYLGEEDRASVRELIKLSVTRAFIYSVITTIVLFVMAPVVSLFFINRQEIDALPMCIECIRISCLSIPYNAIVHTFNYMLTATGKIRFACIYSFLLECGNLVPITFILLRILDHRGAYIAMIVNGLIITGIAVGYVLRFKGSARFRNKVMLLPDSFGIPPEQKMSVIAKSPREIVLLSRVAIAFALENGADMKKAQTTALIIEELSGLFAEYDSNDTKPHNINISLVYKKGDLIVRMYNDYARFNIQEYYDKINKEPAPGDLSLKIIMRIAKDVKYATVFGVNSLTVTI